MATRLATSRDCGAVGGVVDTRRTRSIGCGGPLRYFWTSTCSATTPPGPTMTTGGASNRRQASWVIPDNPRREQLPRGTSLLPLGRMLQAASLGSAPTDGTSELPLARMRQRSLDRRQPHLLAG